MVSCFGNTLKVPHITNRAPKGRGAIFRFFVRAFVVGYTLVSGASLIVGIVIRVKLALPEKCSRLKESVYVSADTLIAVSVLALIFLLLVYVRTKNFKTSADLKPHIALFIIVVMSEMFIAIMANFQSSRMKSTIKDNAHIFAVNDCLEAIQSEHSCCGLYSFAEWLRPMNNSVSSDTSDSAGKSSFPDSCHCQKTEDSFCVNITYSIPSRNGSLRVHPDQSTQGTPSHNMTNTTNFSSSANNETTIHGVVTDTVHLTLCFSSIVSELKTVQLASGVTCLLASVFQLIIFAFQIYLIHNLEGAATVSDSSSPAVINIDFSGPRRSRAVSVVDLNSVQLQPRDPNWSWTSGSVSQDDSMADIGIDNATVQKENLEKASVSPFQVL